MADPRYNKNAVRLPLAPLGVFRSISASQVWVDDATSDYVDPTTGKRGYTKDAAWVELWFYSEKSEQVRSVDMRDLVAPQDYYCEQNLEQLASQPAAERQLPKVLLLEDGSMQLVDGVHRCLLSLIENGDYEIEVIVHTVTNRGF